MNADPTERIVAYAALALIALASGWAGTVFTKRTDPRTMLASLVTGLLGAPIGVAVGRNRGYLAAEPEWYMLATAAGLGALVASVVSVEVVARGSKLVGLWLDYIERRYGPPKEGDK
jgi:uncharacterized membrane protein YeaQ/YmgE (transglycosylase-associated protein family)